MASQNSSSSALTIPGYNTYRKDRAEGRGGGLIFYVREHVLCVEIQCPENDVECICLNVTLSLQMSFILIGVYRILSAKNVFLDKFHDVLKKCSLGKEILILGDLNLNFEDKLG